MKNIDNDECYNLIEDTLKSKNLDDSLRQILKISSLGFLNYYGNDYFNLIYETFLDTNFIITDNIVENNIYPKNNYYANTNASLASTTKIDLEIKENSLHIEDSVIVKENKDYYYLLLNFIHEINHLVNSRNKRLIEDSDNLKLRCGISTVDLLKTNKLQENVLINEGFNQLQSLQILKKIINLDEINNQEVKNFLNNFECYKNKALPNYSYRDLVDALKPLFIDKEFSSIYNLNCIEGNISNISSEFDRKVGENSFKELSKSIEASYNSQSTYTNSLKVESLVKKYQTSSVI